MAKKRGVHVDFGPYPFDPLSNMETMTPTPALKSLQNAFRLFLIDLEALPEEAYSKSMGGKARTVADLVHEVDLVNDHICLRLRDEEQWPWPEGWIVAPEEQRSKAATIEAFKRSSQGVLDTVAQFSPEQLEEKVQTDDGEATRNEQARFMVLHVWYHLGQLNFIQTLLGDDAWHWA